MGLPTDTFYGLAADPYNLRAVELIYEVKSRSKHKPLSLLVESVDQAQELAEVDSSDHFATLARKYWPGPLTIIMKAAARLPLKVTANTGNVAIRVPAASIPLAVIRADGVRQQLGHLIPLIVDGGPSPREVPSTIVDLTGGHWRVLREGTIPTQELTQLLGE